MLLALLFLGLAWANELKDFDFDGDGTIGFGDFVLFAEGYGTIQGGADYKAGFDLNQDGKVSFPDLLLFAENFGKTIPERSPVVSIPDPVLQAAFEKALGKVSGSEITRRELATLTHFEAGFVQGNVENLQGIQWAVNLEKLSLSGRYKDVSPLANLTSLKTLNLFGGFESEDLTPLQHLTQLTHLACSSDSARDISFVKNLTQLTYLQLRGDVLSNLSALKDLSTLKVLKLNYGIEGLAQLPVLVSLIELELVGNDIVDLKPLSGFRNLTILNLRQNVVRDIAPLSSLKSLRRIDLSENLITDITPLLDLPQLNAVNILANPIDTESLNTVIPELMARDIDIEVIIPVSVNSPRIYADNLYLLNVDEDFLKVDHLPLEKYAKQIYSRFADEFDFLIFIVNRALSKTPEGFFGGAYYAGVSNQISGTGKSVFRQNREWGSAGRLKGVLYMSSFDQGGFYFFKRSVISRGPMLHELMHYWANFVVPTSAGPHWGFSSADGILGGFDIEDLQVLSNNRYRTDHHIAPFGWAGNYKPYSPIELYLAGFIPPNQVPELWNAEDGESEESSRGVFSATKITKYTIDDIIAKHGARIPDHTQSQKDFRAMAVLLVDNRLTLDKMALEIISNDVSWFSHPGEDQEHIFNFFEATGGRATIKMDGLAQAQRQGSAKVALPASFGTPPPIIYCSEH